MLLSDVKVEQSFLDMTSKGSDDVQITVFIGARGNNLTSCSLVQRKAVRPNRLIIPNHPWGLYMVGPEWHESQINTRNMRTIFAVFGQLIMRGVFFACELKGRPAAESSGDAFWQVC